MENKKETKQLTIIDEVKIALDQQYKFAVINFFNQDKGKAMMFLSNVAAEIQRNPKLQECTKGSLLNAFIQVAQFGFMPSAISGEAYVLPYKIKGEMVAQFQMGYQGFVTLLYGAGAKSVVSEIVREKDKFSIVNGSIHHEIDPFKTREQRGKAVGAYSIIYTSNGGKVEKFMRGDEILEFAKRYSKSFGTDFSPWNEANDLEKWMWRKTTLKQAAKLAPKNEKLNNALALDNEDSTIADQIKKNKEMSAGLTMGELDSKQKNENKKTKNKENKGELEKEPTAEDNA